MAPHKNSQVECEMVCHPVKGSSSEPSSSRQRTICRPGKYTRNPWLNFLRGFRRTHCNLNAVQVMKEGSKVWRQMSDGEKLTYYREAFKTKPRQKICACPMNREGRIIPKPKTKRRRASISYIK